MATVASSQRLVSATTHIQQPPSSLKGPLARPLAPDSALPKIPEGMLLPFYRKGTNLEKAKFLASMDTDHPDAWHVLRLAAEGSPNLRRIAAARFAQNPTSKGVEIFLSLMRRDDPEARVDAAVALTSSILPDKWQYAPEIAIALKDRAKMNGHAAELERCLRALGPQALNGLLKMMDNEPYHENRVAYLGAIAVLDRSVLVACARDLLPGGHVRERVAVARSLSASPEPDLHLEARASLRDENPEVRAWAVSNLFRSGQALDIKEVAPAVRDFHPTTMRVAVEVLSSMYYSNPQTRGVLEMMLNSDIMQWKELAVRVLARIGDPSASKAFLDMVEDENTRERIRVAALVGVRNLLGPHTSGYISTLIHALNSESARLSRSASRTLAMSNESIDYLVSALRTSSAESRERMLGVFSKGNGKWVSALGALLSEPDLDSELAASICKTLERMGSRGANALSALSSLKTASMELELARKSAMLAIARGCAQSGTGVRALLALTKHEDSYARALAFNTLHLMEDKSALAKKASSSSQPALQ